jgi:hypothetical protein
MILILCRTHCCFSNNNINDVCIFFLFYCLLHITLLANQPPPVPNIFFSLMMSLVKWRLHAIKKMNVRYTCLMINIYTYRCWMTITHFSLLQLDDGVKQFVNWDICLLIDLKIKRWSPAKYKLPPSLIMNKRQNRHDR